MYLVHITHSDGVLGDRGMIQNMIIFGSNGQRYILRYILLEWVVIIIIIHEQGPSHKTSFRSITGLGQSFISNRLNAGRSQDYYYHSGTLHT